MTFHKRPEKELDPAKKPGQIVNFELPLEKAINEYKEEKPKQCAYCGFSYLYGTCQTAKDADVCKSYGGR